MFSDVFDGLIDVSVLTGSELGCVADTGNLLAWDVITTGVGAREERRRTLRGHADQRRLREPDQGQGHAAVALLDQPRGRARHLRPDDQELDAEGDRQQRRGVRAAGRSRCGRTSGEARASYACKQADPIADGRTGALLSKPVCKKLAALLVERRTTKINVCVTSTLQAGRLGYALGDLRVCARAASARSGRRCRRLPTGPDPYNRLGELKARVEVFQHVWDERFLKSLKPARLLPRMGYLPAVIAAAQSPPWPRRPMNARSASVRRV